jgi:BirA family biotin operon repressor/biotin-[acetyl-CoA-carboxylase] ligase
MEIPDLPSGLALFQEAEADGPRASARRRARAGAGEGTVIAIDRPTQPAGRHGRDWLVPPDGGLFGALVLRPGLPAAECAELGPVACVALGRALGTRVAPMTELHYRWPNDVLLNGGKVAGIWLDTDGGGNLEWVAISWAVNTDSVPAALGDDAAALAWEGCDADCDAGELFRAIVRELAAAIATWDESGFAPLARNWRARMPDHSPVRIRCGPGEGALGTLEGVDDAGTLTLIGDDGARSFALAEFFFDEPGDSP